MDRDRPCCPLPGVCGALAAIGVFAAGTTGTCLPAAPAQSLHPDTCLRQAPPVRAASAGAARLSPPPSYPAGPA